MAFTILLRAAGNPDFGEPTDLGVPAESLRVATLEDASRVAQQYIAKHDLGSGNWTGGQVFDAKGKQVAYVSYNGRVWEGACRIGDTQRERSCRVGVDLGTAAQYSVVWSPRHRTGCYPPLAAQAVTGEAFTRSRPCKPREWISRSWTGPFAFARRSVS